MLKRLAILAVWLFCIGAMAGQPNQAANRDGHDAEQGQPAVISPHGQNEKIPAQTKPGDANGNTPAGNAAVERSHWWSDPNWWLVIFAGITGAFICWQSWETHKSAEATRKSVDLSASANSQWIRLRLGDMYSEAEKGQGNPPSAVMLNCRWTVLNQSPQPFTLHKIKVEVARADVWHVCEFDFEEVVPPGEDGKIVIVPIPLNKDETAEYFKDGVEFSIAIGALFTGVNGRQSYQRWGDLFYFCKGRVEWNASLGKSPQREYDEAFEDRSTLVPSGQEIYEFTQSAEAEAVMDRISRAGRARPR